MVWKRLVATFFLLACLGPATAALAEVVLYNFTSPACGPCQQMRPIVEQLSAAGHKIRHVDVLREPQLAAQFRVTQVPTFVLAVDGRETAREGYTTFEQLSAMLARAGSAPNADAPAPVALAANVTPATFDRVSLPTERLVEIQQPAQGRSAVTNPFVGQPTAGADSSADHKRLIEATAKISVEDPHGKSAGTGTIVDARSGEALILTCGHLFRDSAGEGPIMVTMFQLGPNGAQPLGSTFTGRLIDYDLDRDLALVSFRPNFAVHAIPIAPVAAPLALGSAVTTVGCNHGQNPTAISTQVAANDRYQGPPNVEVAGAPVEGRSGGGLFNREGQLVGVCFAADHEGNEGLYASLPSIHAKLDSLKLTMVYRPLPAADAAPANPAVAAPQPDPRFAVRGQDPTVAPPAPPSPLAAAHATAAGALSSAEQATLEEIVRRGANSEVICIIRPQDPGGKSEVITLHNASPAFVDHLARPPARAAGPSRGMTTTAATAEQLLR